MTTRAAGMENELAAEMYGLGGGRPVRQKPGPFVRTGLGLDGVQGVLLVRLADCASGGDGGERERRVPG